MKIQNKALNPLLMTDSYKLAHLLMYPPKTQMVFSTWTPREARDGSTHVVVFGVQAALRKLTQLWQEGFFDRPLADAYDEFASIHAKFLGEEPRREWKDAITRLHEIGRLPLEIRALPEGTLCPIRTPYLTIMNTDPKAAWLTNFIETLLSTELWLPATDATIAYKNRRMVNGWAVRTGVDPETLNFTGHGFEMRGMQNLEAGMRSGAAHLLSWWGTDTLSSFPFLSAYYDSAVGVDYTAGSVPASEHSVMCAWGIGREKDLFEWLATERFPDGFLSVVSDTWDLWTVIGEYLPALKDKIIKRDGRLVIRPDSGVPENILCGDPNAAEGTMQRKGVVQSLWDIFGGTTNDKGFKTLDTHIGVIYGDAMNYTRVDTILRRLAEQGFAANNVVYGFGSYNYTYVTRDTYGFALKSTAVIVDGEYRAIWKDPKTDNGTKKSQKGFVVVNPDLTYTDKLTPQEYAEHKNALQVVFKDGTSQNAQTFKEIRERLWTQ
jgi:nicotinamide phosphoribosyltransferase